MKFLKSYKQFESVDNFCFRSGDCDIYAIALHRLYGYPIYVINGYYRESDSGCDLDKCPGCEWCLMNEPAHLVVKLPNGNYLDCDGESTEDELKSQCGFGNKIEYIKFEPISEDEAIELYSYDPNKEEDIKDVMLHIQDKSKLNESKVNDKRYIKAKGRIVFDPKDVTRKHRNQATWKKMAMITFDGELSEYYAWMIKKRYNLELNRPLRGAHISFINDHIRDIASGLNISEQEAHQKWEEVKQFWNGQEVEIELDPDVRTNGEHWWLVIPEEKRQDLHSIRAQVGLDRPFFGLHMTIGYANEKNIEHSKYIHHLLKTRGGAYN